MPVMGLAGDLQAESGEGADRAGHQALPACLVDGRPARLDHDGVEAGARRVDGGGQAGGTAPATSRRRSRRSRGHRSARAVFSQRMRTASSTALSTVKTMAVIHALCTSGSAAPSTTTAT